MSFAPDLSTEGIKHLVLLHLAATSYKQHTCRVAEVECLVTNLDGVQIVAIRGTEADKLISGKGWRDALRDLRLYPWYDKRVGWSHAGFLKGARGLVDRGLFGMLDRDAPIVLTGHSMGGAVGINAAAILHAEGFNVAGVVGFGTPRTLKRGAVKRFNATKIPIFEYSNPGDPVPMVPLRWFGYRHLNEISTQRPSDGVSATENHPTRFYLEAFNA